MREQQTSYIDMSSFVDVSKGCKKRRTACGTFDCHDVVRRRVDSVSDLYSLRGSSGPKALT